jgi:hypothetical protein
LLGRPDGTVVYTDDNGTVYRNKVWVRIVTDAAVTEIVAENRAVPLHPGLPVRVATINGTPTVIGSDTVPANIYTGGYLSDVAEHAWTHGRFGPDPVYIPGLQFLPLAARPSQPSAMTVTVEQGFYRWEYEERFFATTTSASLSSYVPSNSGEQHYILLSLNRSTEALVITDGTTVQTPLIREVPFTNAEILALVKTIATVCYPLAAIRFYYGQTTVRSPDIFMDLRLWAGEVRLEADIIMTDADGNIMVDGDGNVMVETA